MSEHDTLPAPPPLPSEVRSLSPATISLAELTVRLHEAAALLIAGGHEPAASDVLRAADVLHGIVTAAPRERRRSAR